MLIRFYLLLLCFCATLGNARAQNNRIINGYIEDAESGERLIGAAIGDSTGRFGTLTNSYGYFTLAFPIATEYKNADFPIDLRVSYIGYETKKMRLILRGDTSLNIALSTKNTLQTVEINAKKQDRIENRVQMSQVTVPIEQIKRMPMILGEADVLKTLQFLPGVKSGTEGTAGILVRGGSQDQNLVLLDGVPVYNPTHIGGLFSVFNADALRNVTLTKGGFPARFGGRLSSVLEVDTKDGNKRDYHAEATIGLLLSKLTVEGPIWRDKISFMVSARRTYLDLLLKGLLNEETNTGFGTRTQSQEIYFYDVNAKLNYKINEKHNLYASFYQGFDVFNTIAVEKSNNFLSTNTNGFDFKNVIGSMRWNWVIGKRLFMNTTAHLTNYFFNFGDSTQNFSSLFRADTNAFKFNSRVKDLGIKTDVNYVINQDHLLRFGVGVVSHNFLPNKSTFSSSNFSFEQNKKDTVIGGSQINATESDLYAEYEAKIGNFSANAGLHYTLFNSDIRFASLQPRLSMLYKLGRVALKASYAQMNQFLHVLVNDALGVPTDSWVPSKSGVQPASSEQFAVGVASTLFNDIECSLELYTKQMDNLLAYKEGSGFLSVEADWEQKVTSGRGQSKGIELLVQKKEGRLNGWVSYTLSRTDRQFNAINDEKAFPFRFDRTHELAIVTSYRLNKKITFSLNWTYATGNAVSLPVNIYRSVVTKQTFEGEQAELSDFIDFSARNSFRTRAIHRLDFGCEFYKKRKKYERKWNVGFYNAYNRANPFFFYFIQSSSTVGKKRADQYNVVQYSLLPILPYASFSIKF